MAFFHCDSVMAASFLAQSHLGTTLRKMVRDATAEVVEGMIQLTEVILSTPLQR